MAFQPRIDCGCQWRSKQYPAGEKLFRNFQFTFLPGLGTLHRRTLVTSMGKSIGSPAYLVLGIGHPAGSRKYPLHALFQTENQLPLPGYSRHHLRRIFPGNPWCWTDSFRKKPAIAYRKAETPATFQPLDGSACQSIGRSQRKFPHLPGFIGWWSI